MSTETIEKFLGLNLRDRTSKYELTKSNGCSSLRYPLLSSSYGKGIVNVPAEIIGFCSNGALFILFSISGKGVLTHFNGDAVKTKTYTLDADEDTFGISELANFVKAEYTMNGTTWIKYNGGVTATYSASSSISTSFKLDYDIPSGAQVKITYNYYDVVHSFSIANTNKRQLVPAAGYIYIFPDKQYANVAEYLASGSTNDKGSMEATNTSTMCTIQPCDREGKAYDCRRAPTPPANPIDGQYWLDSTDANNDVLKMYSATSGDWVSLTTTFVAIARYGQYAAFNQWDGVTVTHNSIANIASSVVVYDQSIDHIVVPGFIARTVTNATVTVTRSVPAMDYVIECENRLWGCRYANGINEIYASALGAFNVWNRFLGISTDSYAASRGCPGPWTGAVNYLGSPVFFKEDYIETVYPSNVGAHQISTLNVNGTGCTSGDSIAVVSNMLVYQGSTGFFTYSGTIPKSVSYNLGNNIYSNSVGASLGNVYYVYTKDSNNVWHLYTYDVIEKIWYEDTLVTGELMCRNGSELFTYGGEETYMHAMRGTCGAKQEIYWSAETAEFGYSEAKDSYINEIKIIASGDNGSEIGVSVIYDGSEVAEEVGIIRCSNSHKHITFPFVPARCDHFKIRFISRGNAAIWALIINHNTGR